MELKVVKYEIADLIAIITLNRPHRLNAWTGRMHTEYRWVLQKADHDPEVRVIVVTGAGRAFCAGADTQALGGHVAKGGYDDGVREPLAEPGYGVSDHFDHPFAFHFGLATPILAAVNGPAAGVGLVLACYCDLRFVAADAKLTTAHGKLNLPAEFGLSWVLPRLIGTARAMDLVLSSRVFTGQEAADMGLALQAIDPGDSVLDAARAYAAMLRDTVSPRALTESRRQIYRDLHTDVGTAVEQAQSLMEEMMTEPNFARGVEALQDRTAPYWE